MCVALVVALGGTTYAAVVLPANSLGTAQLTPAVHATSADAAGTAYSTPSETAIPHP